MLIFPKQWQNFVNVFYLEIIRVSKTGERRSQDQEESEPSRKKTKYKSYTGAVVTEDIVKLSEKVMVPVKEYPKVTIFSN